MRPSPTCQPGPGWVMPGYTVKMMSPSIIGSNHLVTRRVDLDNAVLHDIELHAFGNVIVTYTEGEQYLEITADDNVIDYLMPHVDGQKLILSPQEQISTKRPISYRLYIPHHQLNSLIVFGSGSIQLDQLETEKLHCQISGQGAINIKSGHAVQQTVEISGQASYNAARFQTDHSQITLFGQCQAHVHADQSLHITISGMGSCTYSGNPRVQQDISGMGYVTHS
ncbi:MAG: DUF2807 domain-containing protein [Chlamydiia bacterium]|nr:DUF2807 domain-containing protein [Chlamydiia bacterium]